MFILLLKYFTLYNNKLVYYFSETKNTDYSKQRYNNVQDLKKDKKKYQY